MAVIVPGGGHPHCPMCHKPAMLVATEPCFTEKPSMTMMGEEVPVYEAMCFQHGEFHWRHPFSGVMPMTTGKTAFEEAVRVEPTPERVYSQEEVQEILGAITNLDDGGICSVCVRADEPAFPGSKCEECVANRDKFHKWPHFELYKDDEL